MLQIFAASDLVRPIHVLNATIHDSLITSFSVLSDGYQIAVGYNSGAVILFSGRFLHEAASSVARNSAHIMLLTSHAYPVSSLYICEVPSKRPSERKIRLFAVMETPDGNGTSEGEAVAAQRVPDPGINGDDPKFAGVLVFDTSTANDVVSLTPSKNGIVRTLDARGAPTKCATLMKGIQELVVARSEALYNYSIEDRGGALAIPGEKLCVCSGNTHSDCIYIVLVREINIYLSVYLFICI